jgi:ankyrin repeat protein
VTLWGREPCGEDVESSHCKQTPVYTASKNGQITVVCLLLDSGSDVNEMDNYRQTGLAVASLNGELEVAKLLIE